MSRLVEIKELEDLAHGNAKYHPLHSGDYPLSFRFILARATGVNPAHQESMLQTTELPGHEITLLWELCK